MGNMELLNNQLLTEILIKLPTKSIYKSKCVCKRWRLLITKPTFIKRLKSLTPLTTGFFYNHLEESKAKFLASNSNVSSVNIDLSFIKRPSAYVMASHNGLLLCSRRINKDKYSPPTYFVCNPLTKQCFTLPMDRRMPGFMGDTLLYCNDNGNTHNGRIGFKVVHFWCCQYNFIEIDIYSSELGEWKRSMVSHTLADFEPNGIALNQEFVYYWDERSSDLCVFDLKKEGVRFTKLPPKSTNDDNYARELGISAGRVYFLESDVNYFRVWVFTNGVKWSLEHSIRTQCLVDQLPKTLDLAHPYFIGLAFHPVNKEIGLVLQGNTKVFLYNMDRKRIELMGDFDFGYAIPFIPYSLPAWIPSFRIT